ncbi:MAG: cation diffusion facilitator family transporter [Longimicrobiales bacterium]
MTSNPNPTAAAEGAQRPPYDRARRHAEVRRVLVLTLMANLIGVALKLSAGLNARSLAVVAEAAHSSLDAWNNVLALVLAGIAAQAPDEEHPYGHAKFETLAALGIVAFISITVYELVRSAISRLILGSIYPDVGPFVIAAMIGSAVLNFGVSHYESRRGRELRSEILLADAAHTRSDMYASVAVLVGLGIASLGFERADASFTLLVAAVIGRAGYRILRRSVPILVDARAAEPDTIRRIALASEGVVDAFDVRSRGRQGEAFAELTITVDPKLDVAHAHRIADAVERNIAAELGARDVVVHVEPAAPAGARRL